VARTADSKRQFGITSTCLAGASEQLVADRRPVAEVRTRVRALARAPGSTARPGSPPIKLGGTLRGFSSPLVHSGASYRYEKHRRVTPVWGNVVDRSRIFPRARSRRVVLKRNRPGRRVWRFPERSACESIRVEVVGGSKVLDFRPSLRPGDREQSYDVLVGCGLPSGGFSATGARPPASARCMSESEYNTGSTRLWRAGIRVRVRHFCGVSIFPQIPAKPRTHAQPLPPTRSARRHRFGLPPGQRPSGADHVFRPPFAGAGIHEFGTSNGTAT